MASMSRVMNDEKKTVVSIDITNNLGYYVSFDDYPFNNLIETNANTQTHTNTDVNSNKFDGVCDSRRLKFERVPTQVMINLHSPPVPIFSDLKLTKFTLLLITLTTIVINTTWNIFQEKK